MKKSWRELVGESTSRGDQTASHNCFIRVLVSQRELGEVVPVATIQHRSRLELTGIEKVGLSLIANDILL